MTEIIDNPGEGLDFELIPPGIGVLTFDRPEQLNAIDWSLYRGLATAVERMAHRSDIHVVLLRGAGRAFCSGGDIGFMRQMFEGEIDKADVGDVAERLFTAQLSLPQPALAVVDGPAVGLGATIALGCDLVFAGERATFADPHVQMGLVPGDGGAVLWQLRIGPAKAKEFLFTGDPVNAVSAYQLGLVNHVYPSAEVFDRALDFARRLASGPTRTMRAIKALTNHVTRSLGNELIRAGLAMEAVSQESEYHREAVKRFLADDPLRF